MFEPLHMGINHLMGVDAAVPLTQNNFEIRIYNMDGTSPSSFADILTLSTNEIGEIQEEQDTITVHYGNGQIKFPSKVSFADVDWTLNCYCEPNVLEGLREWRKQVYDPETEKMGIPSSYMKTAYFLRYDGQGNCRDVIKCPGVWIKGLSNGGNNQEGGLVQVKTTLVISRAIYMSPDDF